MEQKENFSDPTSLHESHVDNTQQTPSSDNDFQSSHSKSSKSIFIWILIGVIVLLFIGGGVVGYKIFMNQSTNTASVDTSEESTTSDTHVKTQQEAPPTDNGLSSFFSSVEQTYAGEIPWENLNSREAYQFFPDEIGEFPVATGQISVHTDNNYNPLTVMPFDENTTVPLKNSYVGYYEIPEVVSDQYGIDEFDVVFPIELKLYEFDRTLTDTEHSLIAASDSVDCYNNQAETEVDTYMNDNVIVHSCLLNATAQQQEETTYLYEESYLIYLVERNILLQIGFDMRYIDNPQLYVDDYLTKLFGTNTTLFINEDQIQSPGEAREFEEWRQETFGN